MKNISLAVSTVFHPLLIPTWGFLLLFISNNPYGFLPFEYKGILWLIILTFTFIIPAIFITILKNFKIIQSYQMHYHKERIVPLLIVFISYFAGVFVLRKFNAPYIIPLLLTVSTISIGLAGLVSMAWKISAHLTGMGGLIAAIIVVSLHLQVNYSLFAASVILLAGIVGWARLHQNAHDKDQILAGFILGFACTYFPVLLTPILK